VILTEKQIKKLADNLIAEGKLKCKESFLLGYVAGTLDYLGEDVVSGVILRLKEKLDEHNLEPNALPSGR